MVALLISTITYWLYQPWTPHWLDGKSYWYSLYWKGEKVGHVQQSYQLQADGIFQITQQTRVNTRNRGQSVNFSEKEVYRFDTDENDELSSAFYHRQQGDYVEQVSLTHRQGLLEGEKRLGKKKSILRLDSENYQLSDYLELMRWASTQPSSGQTLTTRRFDLQHLSINPVQYLVEEQDSNEQYLTVSFQEQGRDWKGEVYFSSAGLPLGYTVGQMVELELATKSEALSQNSQADYYQSQVIGLDQPLGDIKKLKSLTLATNLLPEGFVVNNARQSMDQNGNLRLHDESAITSINGLKSAQDKTQIIGEFDKAFPEGKQDQKLSELVSLITGDSSNPEEIVMKLLGFVSETLVDAPVIRPMSVATILEQRKGDCTEHTQLFIALARASKIPAREVKGLVYLGDEVQGFGGHVWSEVLINERWVAVDPTWNLAKLSATHIQLTPENDDVLLNKMHKDAGIQFSLKAIEYQ